MRTRLLEADMVEDPVIDLSVVLELERADRMSDVLERVLEAVCIVVQRVDAPVVALPVVVLMPDAVEHRVPHQHVRSGHVDLAPQHVRTVLELPSAHAAE